MHIVSRIILYIAKLKIFYSLNFIIFCLFYIPNLRDYYMDDVKKIRRKNTIIKYFFLLASTFTLLLIAKYFFYINTNTQSQETNKSVKLPKNLSLKIDHSIFEGLNKENLPYKILASSVKKKSNNLYNLDSINAFYMSPNGQLEILAKSGVLDDETKIFILSNDVRILYENLILKSEKINFDINSNSASSKLPVELNFKKSKIKAMGFNTEEENNIINFEGNVISTIDLDDFKH